MPASPAAAGDSAVCTCGGGKAGGGGGGGVEACCCVPEDCDAFPESPLQTWPLQKQIMRSILDFALGAGAPNIPSAHCTCSPAHKILPLGLPAYRALIATLGLACPRTVCFSVSLPNIRPVRNSANYPLNATTRTSRAILLQAACPLASLICSRLLCQHLPMHLHC